MLFLHWSDEAVYAATLDMDQGNAILVA